MHTAVPVSLTVIASTHARRPTGYAKPSPTTQPHEMRYHARRKHRNCRYAPFTRQRVFLSTRGRPSPPAGIRRIGVRTPTSFSALHNLRPFIQAIKPSFRRRSPQTSPIRWSIWFGSPPLPLDNGHELGHGNGGSGVENATRGCVRRNGCDAERCGRRKGIKAGWFGRVSPAPALLSSPLLLPFALSPIPSLIPPLRAYL